MTLGNTKTFSTLLPRNASLLYTMTCCIKNTTTRLLMGALCILGFLHQNAHAQEWAPATRTLSWHFPIQRPHAGLPMANGTQGALIWGAGRELHITIAHQGFWDHRGGRTLGTGGPSYTELIQLLSTGTDTEIRKRLAQGAAPNGPASFQQLGGGRCTLTLPQGWQLHKAVLSLSTGHVEVQVLNPNRIAQNIKVVLDMYQQVAGLVLPSALVGKVSANLTPAYTYCGTAMAARGISPPDTFSENSKGSSTIGFVQKLPADAPLTAVLKTDKNTITWATTLGDSGRTTTEKLLNGFDANITQRQAEKYWQYYWQRSAKLYLPHPTLQEAYDYGMYMQGICTPPQGLAASLQGPLLEEYQLPPWAADYHWNVNVQMLYWPALSTGHAEHMKPLWTLVEKLLPQLQANGKGFFQDEQALVLPHATDDRGQVSGTFWSGMLDVGCLAWLADMSWQYYQHTADTSHLRTITWPLLQGTLASYQRMFKDTVVDGRPAKVLPYSVSPEWRGSQVSSVGRNSSYQLAAVHATLRNLSLAAQELGMPQDPLWQQLMATVPKYSAITTSKVLEYPQYQHKRIALFEGQDLIESHRHHSHMAGIYPFMTLMPDDTTAQQHMVLQNTVYNWLRKGAGSWTGWCLPWASVLSGRMGMPEAAVSWLMHWQQNFVNEGRGTLHDAAWAGVTTAFKQDAYRETLAGRPNKEIMQLDARMGATHALTELLVRQWPDHAEVLTTLPRAWKDLGFKDIHLAGGFTVSGLVKDGQCVWLKVQASRKGKLKLKTQLPADYTVNGLIASGQWQTLNAETGSETWTFKALGYTPPRKWVDWNPKKSRKKD